MKIEEGGGDMAGVPVTERGPWMQLGGGRIFHPLDPSADEVNIDDIATSLSRIIRYNGHSDIWVVVAQHCCNCVTLARADGHNNRFLYALLLHDAAEAYVGDMTRPLKCALPEFKRLELNVYEVIEEALEIPKVSEDVIKHYDNLAWAWEKRDFFYSAREWPFTPELADDLPQLFQWNHGLARSKFLEEYYRLACLTVDEDWPYHPEEGNTRGSTLKAVMDDVLEENLDSFIKERDTRDWRDV